MLKRLCLTLLCCVTSIAYADALPFELSWQDSPESADQKLSRRLELVDGYQDARQLIQIYQGKYRGFDAIPITLRFQHDQLVQLQIRFQKLDADAFKYWQKLVRQWQHERGNIAEISPKEMSVYEPFQDIHARVSQFGWQPPKAVFEQDNQTVVIWVGKNASHQYQLRMDFAVKIRE